MQIDRIAERRGSGLLTAMIVVTVISLVTATFVAIAQQRAFVVRKLADRTKAIAIAEAGLNEAYSRLSTNFALRNDPSAFPLTSYGGGAYQVTVRNVDHKTVVLTSSGRCSAVAAAVVADVRDYGNSSSDSTNGQSWASWDTTCLDYAIVCGSIFTFKGCGDATSGTNGPALMHSNDKMDIGGNAGVGVDVSSSQEISIGNKGIEGSATAPVIVGGDGAAGGAFTQAVPNVTIPNIDMTPYFSWAMDHGEVYTNGFSMSGGVKSPNGGVMWVMGDVHLSSWTTVNGTIIATGNISLSSKIDINPSEYGFGLVSLDGDISNQSGGTVKGITYVRNGDYDQTANGEMQGQLIVSGAVKKGGNSDLILYNHYTPTLPDNQTWGGLTAGVTNIPVISAWQK